MTDQWKKIDEIIKKDLLEDNDLHDFLKPIFRKKRDRHDFINQSLQKTKSRRMLLRAQWYMEIADDQERIRQSRPALKLIFLIAMAETIAKRRTGNKYLRSLESIKEFFKYISAADQEILYRGFQRILLKPGQHSFRFSSILKILYNVRNQAVHGEDYYSFHLMTEGIRENNQDRDHFSIMTSGYLGTIKRKKLEHLEVTLSYEELRDIFRRTAIENIKAVF